MLGIQEFLASLAHLFSEIKNTWVVLESIFMTRKQNDLTDENVFWWCIIVYNFLHDIFQPYALAGVCAVDCAVWQANVITHWNDRRWEKGHKTWQFKCNNVNDIIFPLKWHVHIMPSSMQSKVKRVSCWTVGAVRLSVSTYKWKPVDHRNITGSNILKQFRINICII